MYSLILLSEPFIESVVCCWYQHQIHHYSLWPEYLLLNRYQYPPVQQVLLFSFWASFMKIWCVFFFFWLHLPGDFLSAAIYTRHISFNELVQCLLERACEWVIFVLSFHPSLSFCFFLLSISHSQTYLVLQQNILVHCKELNDALAHVKRNCNFSLLGDMLCCNCYQKV